jgi:5'(3')-deoxyribonucleotidase
MRIGIDVDGVLANYNPDFIARIIAVTGNDLFPPQPFDIPCWNYPQHYGYTDVEVMQAVQTIHDDPTFWYNLAPYADARDFLGKLNSHWHDIYFVTHRGGKEAKKQTEDWLEYQGFGAETNALSLPTVLISADKGAIAKALKLDLYIDDKQENCLDVNATSPSTKMVMMARTWNHAVPGMARVETLAEFARFIEPF